MKGQNVGGDASFYVQFTEELPNIHCEVMLNTSNYVASLPIANDEWFYISMQKPRKLIFKGCVRTE